MINNKIKTIYECFDGLVGLRNCDKEYSIYLDDYGLSLDKIANVVDSASLSGKNLIDTLVAQSIDDVVSDVTFKEFQANKILNDVELGTVDIDTYYTGTKERSFVLDKSCTLGAFYLSNLEYHVKTSGVTTITLIQSGETTTLYTGTPTETALILIKVNAFVGDFTIRVVTAGELYNYSGQSACGCNNPNYWTTTNTDSDSFSYGQINFQIRCNKAKHLCKYSELLGRAVVYRTMAKYYYQLYSTSAFNNETNSKGVDALSQAVYYDSTYINLVNTERNPNEKFGQYQLELEKLNKIIPVPKCKACVTCDSVGWRETINIP